MKKLWIALMCLATTASADEASMYDSDADFLADLELMSARCGSMLVGQVEEEIFGLQFTRVGERCVIGKGEIDPLAQRYLTTHKLAWAGLDGEDSIWVIPSSK